MGSSLGSSIIFEFNLVNLRAMTTNIKYYKNEDQTTFSINIYMCRC